MMTKTLICGALLGLLPAVFSLPALGQAGRPDLVVEPGDFVPIQKVEIGANRSFLVNGKPFFPVMGWLQGEQNLPLLKKVGINSIAGYWRDANGKGPVGNAPAYAAKARAAGLYFLPPYEPKYAEEMKQLKGADVLLAWMHSDEPDLPKTRSDAEIAPGPGLIVNNSRPLYTMFDGNAKTSAVLDPLDGAAFTIKLKAPATVTALAVQSTAESPKSPVAKEVVFTVGGKEILKVALKNSKDLQKFELLPPVTFQELSVKITAVYPGEIKWGVMAEVQAFDKDGKNVLLSPTRKEPQESPAETLARYQALKAFDATRPMFMTVTDFFSHDATFYNWWPREMQDKLYPEFVKAADVVGFDVYPIYGWNQPGKITWVSQGMDDLRQYAGPNKPLYQWIETLTGTSFGDKANKVTGVEIRNEVWQAIIHGATAIGYFTHRFGANFSEFGVPEENQKAMREINAQLTRLTPVLCSPEAKVQPKIEIEGGAAAQALAKDASGQMYIFAQNIAADGKTGKGTLKMEGLKAGTAIEVVDEGRTLTSEDGQFRDDFGRLAVHIYRVKA